MIGAPFPDDTSGPLRAARANAQIMGDAMRAAWEAWIAAECLHEPVVLVLEDLQWGDAATVRLVDSTLRNLHDRPILVVAAARPEIHARFRGLWAARDVHELKLAPLDRWSSDALVRRALGEEIAQGVVDGVVDRANGNPFTTSEEARPGRGRGAPRDTLPDSVLPGRWRRAAWATRRGPTPSASPCGRRACSAIGSRRAAWRRCSAATGRYGGDARPGSITSRPARSTSRLPSPPRAHRPRRRRRTSTCSCSALVREVAYATLTEADRALGHRLAGAWLEAGGSTDAVALAEHPCARRRAAAGRAVGTAAARKSRWPSPWTISPRRSIGRGSARRAAPRGRKLARSGWWRRRRTSGAATSPWPRRREWRASLALPGRLGGLVPGSLDRVVVAARGSSAARRARSAELLRGRPARRVPGAKSTLSARISLLCACAANLTFAGRYADADAALETLARRPDPPAPLGRGAATAAPTRSRTRSSTRPAPSSPPRGATRSRASRG